MRELCDRVIVIVVKEMIGTVGVRKPHLRFSVQHSGGRSLHVLGLWAPVSGTRVWQMLCSLRVRNKQHFVPPKYHSAFLLTSL